jgi:hypothetical protein
MENLIPRLDFLADTWFHILSYMQLSDFASLLSTDKLLRERLLEDEEAYMKLFACLKYPMDTVDVQLYGQSWKILLQDDNARGGCYTLSTRIVSEWRANSDPFFVTSHFYINAVRHVVWDRQVKCIYIIIEAYGNQDLRDAHTTTIFHVPLDNFRGTRYEPQSYHYLINQNGHKLCILRFPEDIFNQGHTCDFWFTYNGSETIRGSDYPAVPFLRCEPSLRDTFNLSRSECDFRPKTFCEQVKPSDVQSWGRHMNDNIIQQMHRGQWG